MATSKKSDSAASTAADPTFQPGNEDAVAERRRRREEATTVDGSETQSSANAGGEPPA